MITSKRDYLFAFAIGAASSVLWFFVLKHLSLFSTGKFIFALVLVPFLCVAAVWVTYTFFRATASLPQKALKFLMVGVLNTGIDFFIFDSLIVWSGKDIGPYIVLFKSLSFLCALFNSYELNRWWTFDEEAGTSRSKGEFKRFAVVTLAGFLINVGSTSLIIAAMHPFAGISQIRWDNIAAGVATTLNLVWNFTGYKLFVFRPSTENPIITSHVI